jgi:pyrimidine deaminase RibD-like protein
MTRDEIINIVKEFLTTEPIKFSQHWENKLVERLWKIRSKNVSVEHGRMQTEIQKKCKDWLLSEYPYANADDIVQDAWIKWRRSNFNGTISSMEGSPEKSAMMQNTIWVKNDEHRKESKIDKVQYDESGYDKPDESDEANTSSDEYFEDAVEVSTEIDNSQDESEAEEIFYDDTTEESISEEVIEQLPSTTETHEEKIKIKTRYINDKRFAEFAVLEVKTFFEFAKRKIESGRFQPKRSNQVFKPIRKTTEDKVREEFQHLKNSTLYYKERFNFLKNGEKRKWMEVANAEMRKSKAKLEEHILKLKKDNADFNEHEYRKQKPILSAVVLDKNGKKIATCFKGEINHMEGERDLTFDLHCEYALFKHVVTDDNMHLLKDGTLYVTLEPCNKRGYWLDGEVEKPKIPCAVRCVEARVKTVYIGSLDDNKEVYKKGELILRTGKCFFELQNGSHAGSQKEKRASELLEEYFRDEKKYQAENIADKIVYTIGEPVIVKYFDSDLMEDVRGINSYFLQKHNEKDFR